MLFVESSEMSARKLCLLLVILTVLVAMTSLVDGYRPAEHKPREDCEWACRLGKDSGYWLVAFVPYWCRCDYDRPRGRYLY